MCQVIHDKYPAILKQPWLLGAFRNLIVCLSVCLSVCVCVRPNLHTQACFFDVQVTASLGAHTEHAKHITTRYNTYVVMCFMPRLCLSSPQCREHWRKHLLHNMHEHHLIPTWNGVCGPWLDYNICLHAIFDEICQPPIPFSPDALRKSPL